MFRSVFSEGERQRAPRDQDEIPLWTLDEPEGRPVPFKSPLGAQFILGNGERRLSGVGGMDDGEIGRRRDGGAQQAEPNQERAHKPFSFSIILTKSIPHMRRSAIIPILSGENGT